ncbi:NAD(P)/FAD-dependent oxidoreductase [Pedobacter boryungensis]|uniref:NAD(P)/FAD-dependent oxidoreductase n=1 Tax=Pedobacter boryungensis TaxID=869962 RepID=A0ABX2DHG7_9SPHI|nr:NAD(P)/FAD-dependent oxidoreductase [Pedobacter boryungensis]NQX32569.1 NAD(P)/FAD-dependent oxidoreductase [Pedobacter boryungensis]
MDFKSDVLIVGGGLAGLTAALHLHKAGLKIILIEKSSYPHHKVCGEYVSNEVLPYFEWLNIDINKLYPTHINRLQLTTVSGKSISVNLPLGGFGISRYELDNFLYQQLLEKGIEIIEDTVNEITFDNGTFLVNTLTGKKFISKQVIGAYGKRSTIDVKLDRPFIKEKSPYLAVKAHYKGNFPDDLVAVHNFNGGYCGVSKVENQHINICYLANYATFKAYKNIETYQQKVLHRNKHLAEIFENSEIIFEAPLTISQLAFGAKTAVADHILFIGDTAGLIHPLCGNGMAMAIHSAKICSELLLQFFDGIIFSRTELEKKYTTLWNEQFRSRLKMGSILSSILRKDKLTDMLLTSVIKIPFFLQQIIKKTHGKPLIFDK